MVTFVTQLLHSLGVKTTLLWVECLQAQRVAVARQTDYKVCKGVEMEMTQFRVCHAIYAGYTLIYLMEVDSEGYLIGEHTIRSESNNIRLNQNFR